MKLTNNIKRLSTLGVKYATALLAFSLWPLQATDLAQIKGNTPLTFENSIKEAQKNDPWLTGNIHKQQAIEALSSSASSLPDPKMSIGLANFPTNGFDFGQEGMTQAKVSVSQMFPRGDTLDIKSQQLKIQGEAFPYQRLDRESKVAVIVGSLWLDAYRVQQSITLIENNRSLFEQLADVATASYSSTIGKTRQQDIVRAQLELTRLDDRLNLLAQHKSRYAGMLSQWLLKFDPDGGESTEIFLSSDFALHNLVLSQTLPQIDLLNPDLMTSETRLRPEALVQYFASHPAVMAIEKNIQATKTGIDLAEQKYSPQWGVNLSYGHRADDALGNSRADLLSVGVTFDLPLFTENRQDKEVQSAVSATEAMKTEKLLFLRQLLGSYASAKGRLLRLIDRQDLYRTKLMPQIHDQAEASLTAYTNDDGDFSEVVRARIAVLNAQIDDLTLSVEEQKIRLELNYLFIGSLSSSQGASHINNNTNFSNSKQTTAVLGAK